MAVFTVELRGQTVTVSVSQDEASLEDEEGSELNWRLDDDEWFGILEAAESHGYEPDDWHYGGGEDEPCDPLEIEQKQGIRRNDLQWARGWYEGRANCPHCRGTHFALVDVETAGALRYETFRCTGEMCGTRWKVEYREGAVAVLHAEFVSEGDWIELQVFNSLRRVDLSEREAATIQAALRYWRREGPGSAGHERDIETDCGRLQPLSTEEIDALLARVAPTDGDPSNKEKS